jgi:hypothetical protein
MSVSSDSPPLAVVAAAIELGGLDAATDRLPVTRRRSGSALERSCSSTGENSRETSGSARASKLAPLSACLASQLRQPGCAGAKNHNPSARVEPARVGKLFGALA